MDAQHDLFFSYASADKDLAQRLVAALEGQGLKVWFDTNRVDAFDGILPQIAAGLATSKALIALYSPRYAQRRACAWELTAALIAAGPDPTRILTLNCGDDATHIEPERLRHAAFATVAADSSDEALRALAQRAHDHVKRIAQPLGQIPAPASATRWVGLKPRGGPRQFVGRQREIWKIHDGLADGSVLLAPHSNGLAPHSGEAALRGMGGIGKSLLAEEYARRFAAAWPGGVFWLRAGGDQAGSEEPAQQSARLAESYRAVADAVDVPNPPTDPAALRRATIRALESDRRPYLWVVDDLPYGLNTDQVRDWFAPTHEGRTLITTRDRGVGAGVTAIDLGALSDDEAYALLTHGRAPRDLTEAEKAWAREIVTALGGHALAVDLARHLAQRGGYRRLAEGLMTPDAAALELAAQLRLELPNGHEASVAATLRRSLDLLTPAQKDVLRIAALGAANQPWPLEILAQTLAIAAGQDPADADSDAALILVDGVAAHSLCELDDGVCQVHGLVSRTLRHSPAEAPSPEWRAALTSALLLVMPAAAKDIRRHGEIAALIPHAQALAAAPQTADEAAVLDRVGWYFRVAGAYGAAREAFGAAYAARRRLLGEEHPDTLTSLNNLAAILLSLGDYAAARAMQETVLATRRRVLGDEHPDTLTSMQDLATILLLLGDYASARAMQETVLATQRRVLGEDHPSILTSMNNLAGALSKLGDYTTAREMQESVLATQRRVWGYEHPDTLTSVNNLAWTLFHQGEFAEAIALMRQAVAGGRKILGPDHPDTLASEKNLAFMQDRLKRGSGIQGP